MKRILTRIAASKIAWVGVALLLLYTLGGFLLAPYLLERALPRYAEQHLGQQASVGNIRINPYLFTFDMSDFQLGTGDNSILKFERLHIDFELSSIFRGAWTFADIRTEGLDLRLEIDREGRLNIMELVKGLQSPEQTKPSPPPSLIFEHLAVSDSSLYFSDLSGATPASTTLTPINLELIGFSTIPDQEGHYTLAASLPAGASLAWKGNISLYPLASSGEFSLKGLKLATAWQFLRDELRIAEPQGEFALAGRYGFSYVDGNAKLGLSGIEAEISDLLVAPPAGKPALLALRSIRISDAHFALDEREFVVPRLSLSEGKLSAGVASDGKLDWQGLVITKGAKDGAASVHEETDAAEPAKQPWHARVESVNIEKIALAYTDHALSPALAFRIEALNSKFKLDMTTGAGPTRVVVEDMQLAVNNTAIAPAAADAAPLAALGSFRLAGGRVDTHARTALVKNVVISNGDVRITRGPDGPVGLLQWVLPASPESKENLQPAAPVSKASKASADASWKYRVGSLEVEQFGAHLADQSFKPLIAYDINVASADLENIDSASESPIVFATELRIGEQGVINGSGTLGQDFKQAHGKFDVKDITLEPLSPLVARYVAADLKSGRIGVSAELNYRSEASPMITAQGSASIQDFRLDEADGGERLLSWETFFAKKIALSFKPDRLVIKEMHLHEPAMKLVIHEDRSINLSRILKSNPSGGGAADRPPEAAAKKAAQSKDSSPFRAEIRQVRIEKGFLDFADLSLALPFSTHVHALDGSIAGISSAPSSRAQVELTGQVETYGEASASGVLMPRDPKKFLDIEANFENITMPPFSPYSVTFAGRKIAGGKLWLTLHYKIINGNLEGENKVVLADFKLGEQVESPNALDLPLDLAIALLKGPDGRINLAVPVEGDLSNPRFDYGTVIRAALANVIRRIVSSPFRMLAGLVGEQAEQLRKVEFEPGSDSIAPAQREQLDNLAQILKERPQIKLVVQGPYDAQRDGQRLRSEGVRHALASAMGTTIEPGEESELVAYGDADTQKALEKLLAERAGPNSVKEFVDEYAKRTGHQPERVNALLGLFGHGSKDHDFYTALFERLVELQPLPDNALQLLASDRRQAIIDVLLKAGIDSKRLISGSVEQVTGKPDMPVAAELSLDVAPEKS